MQLIINTGKTVYVLDIYINIYIYMLHIIVHRYLWLTALIFASAALKNAEEPICAFNQTHVTRTHTVLYIVQRQLYIIHI